MVTSNADTLEAKRIAETNPVLAAATHSNESAYDGTKMHEIHWLEAGSC